MRINYLDTVTMYYECPFDFVKLFTNYWRWDNRDKNCNFHHFCIKAPHCFVRYFPNMYGYQRLYITFSLPKLYYQCNSNVFNVSDYDNHTFMKILYSELGTVLDVSKLPTSIADWQPSRIDLFRTRTINPLDRMEYLIGYGRRSYRGNSAITYMNTNYLVANNNSKHHGIVERDYNKTVEMQDKQSMLYGNLPIAIENQHEWLMHELETPADQFRYELALRRKAIIKYIQKFNRLLNMETVMDEQFQKMVLNDLVIKRGLNRQIFCKNDYRRIVKVIFKTTHSQKLALQLAESIRNKKPLPMSQSQFYRIKKELNSYFVNTATTNFVTIDGLDLLNY